MAYTTREREAPTDGSSGKAPLSRWQMITIALMLVGYAGYYLCRVHLSVATPLLLEAFKAQGLTKETAFISNIRRIRSAWKHARDFSTMFRARGPLRRPSVNQAVRQPQYGRR